MRLIDADAFKKWLLDNSINEQEIEESKQIGIWLDVFPTANQWIPVSERLPDVNVPVLVTDGDAILVNKLVEPRTLDVVGYHWRDNFGYNLCFDEWVAWMPLPEPWKEGNNEVE